VLESASNTFHRDASRCFGCCRHAPQRCGHGSRRA
jgi:hypothetical protein